MECSKIRELMHGCIDADISADELLQLNKHLENCKECREYYNALKRQTEALSSLRPKPANVDMLGIVREAKRAKTAKMRKTLSVCVSAAAVLVITVISASFILNHGGVKSDSRGTESYAAAYDEDVEFSASQRSFTSDQTLGSTDDTAQAQAPAAEVPTVTEAPAADEPAFAPMADAPAGEPADEACETDGNYKSSYSDVKPSLMHNGIIYCSTGRELACTIAPEAIVGKVDSVTDGSDWPEKDGQANFDIIGADYAEIIAPFDEPQQGIAVNIDNEWVFFEPLK